MPDAEADVTSLASYVNSDYKDKEENRADLTAKWHKNLNAYRRINNGFWKAEECEGWRSKAFDAITKQKIVAAVSICLDAYLAGGKIPFDLKASPIEMQALGITDDTETDAEVQKQLESRLDTMRKVIEGQFTLCDADKAMINHFMSGAVYGITYAKTSVEPYLRQSYVPIQDTLSPSMEQARYDLEEEEFDSPSWNYVTPWDIFTDYEETDLKKTHSVIHRQIRSPFQLVEALEGQPGVLDIELKKALKAHSSRQPEETDSTSELNPAIQDIPNRKQTVRYLEYWGRIPRSILKDFMDKSGADPWSLAEADDDEQEGRMVELLVGVIDDTVVRLAVIGNAKHRPFYCAKWEDNFEGQGGIGVADNTEDVQMMRNGVIRLFFDNKALSANVQLALKRNLLAKKLKSFVPGSLVDISDECDDVRKAVQQIIVQDVGESLLSAIDLTEKWADDDSMVPKIQQGAGGDSGDTAYELQQRLEKSGKYLARVMGNMDNGITEPVAQYFYEWNMSDPRAEGKGSYEVFATGFTSFQDKIKRLAVIRELLNVAAALPEGQAKLAEIFKEIAKMGDVDPDQFLTSEAEIAAQQPDPVDVAEVDKTESETNKNNAQAQAAITDAQVATEELKLKQLDALKPESENNAG